MVSFADYCIDSEQQFYISWLKDLKNILWLWFYYHSYFQNMKELFYEIGKIILWLWVLILLIQFRSIFLCCKICAEKQRKWIVLKLPTLCFSQPCRIICIIWEPLSNLIYYLTEKGLNRYFTIHPNVLRVLCFLNKSICTIRKMCIKDCESKNRLN